jgi:hypothetical protein
MITFNCLYEEQNVNGLRPHAVKYFTLLKPAWEIDSKLTLVVIILMTLFHCSILVERKSYRFLIATE